MTTSPIATAAVTAPAPRSATVRCPNTSPLASRTAAPSARTPAANADVVAVRANANPSSEPPARGHQSKPSAAAGHDHHFVLAPPAERAIGRRDQQRDRRPAGSAGSQVGDHQQRQHGLRQHHRERSHETVRHQRRISGRYRRNYGNGQACVRAGGQTVRQQSGRPGRVRVKAKKHQPDARDRQRGRTQAVPVQQRRHGQHDDCQRGQHRGPAANADSSPRDDGEDDRGNAEQQAAEAEQDVLHGPR